MVMSGLQKILLGELRKHNQKLLITFSSVWVLSLAKAVVNSRLMN